MLDSAAKEDNDGIVMYSMMLMPQNKDKRHKLYLELNRTGKSLHFAAENISINDLIEADALEQTFDLMEIVYGRNDLSAIISSLH